MKFRESFFKWGFKEADAEEVIRYDVFYELHQSERGNEQVMYVGFIPTSESLVEVAVEVYPEGQEDWVFHARKASARSKKWWNKRQ